MAKQTVVTEILVDDLDGSPAERTVRFSWEGTSYELELSKRNATAFDKVMKPYVAAARRSKGAGRPRRAAGSARGAKRDLGPVREWAAKNGYPVSTRGRVAASIIEAYDAANG